MPFHATEIMEFYATKNVLLEFFGKSIVTIHVFYSFLKHDKDILKVLIISAYIFLIQSHSYKIYIF